MEPLLAYDHDVHMDHRIIRLACLPWKPARYLEQVLKRMSDDQFMALITEDAISSILQNNGAFERIRMLYNRRESGTYKRCDQTVLVTRNVMRDCLLYPRFNDSETLQLILKMMPESLLIDDSILLQAAAKQFDGHALLDVILEYDSEITISMDFIEMLYDIASGQRDGVAILFDSNAFGSDCQKVFDILARHGKILDFTKSLWEKLKVRRGRNFAIFTMGWDLVAKYVHEADAYTRVSIYAPRGLIWEEAKVVYPMKLINGIPDNDGDLPWDYELSFEDLATRADDG